MCVVGLRSHVEGERATALGEEQPAVDADATGERDAASPGRLWPHQGGRSPGLAAVLSRSRLASSPPAHLLLHRRLPWQRPRPTASTPSNQRTDHVRFLRGGEKLTGIFMGPAGFPWEREWESPIGNGME